MVNLEHLQVVEAICSEGSFQKASEKLHKVRSAVSYSVKQLETHYGIQIFNRTTYRPELTPEGRILMVQIRRLLNQANEFDAFVSEMKGLNETELRLGVGSLFPINKITGLLTELRSEFPHTTIHLEIEVASGERRLMDEKVDIAIFGSLTRNSAIDYKKVDTINIPLVISKDLLDKNRKIINEDDLATYPQIIIKSSDRQSPDTYVVEDALKWYVTDLSTKKSLITAGLGWGRMPLHLVEQEINNGELVCLDAQGELNLPIYITKLKNKTLGPVALTIWNYFL